MRKADNTEQCKIWKMDAETSFQILSWNWFEKTAENHKNLNGNNYQPSSDQIQTSHFPYDCPNIHATETACTYLCDKVTYKGYISVAT
jgi:hypothetical protein